MTYFKYLRTLFSSRVIAASLLIGFLLMTQARAWDRPAYYYPPAYYQAVTYSTGYQYPRGYYFPGYYSPPPATRTPSQQKPENLTLQGHSKQKIKAPDNSISEKKQAFIKKLLPFIERENARTLNIRLQASKIIRDLDSAYNISQQSRQWLQQTGKQYRVKGDPLTDKLARAELLKKVDIIPASLTLAQAANESAWGQSRFATQANNLFGIWTYDKSKGLVPQNRSKTKKHLVRKFDNLSGSVRYYMLMLNSHPAYKKLREVRFQLRQNNRIPDGHTLAAGLEKYSAKGDGYIKLIRELIRQNQWTRLDSNIPSA